jgi:hypothetical protein
MIPTKTEMVSVQERPFMRTITLANPKGLADAPARLQHSALNPVPCAECGLLA